MLYLLQFFVYCAEAKSGSELSETLKAMERRPLKEIVSPAMIAVWLTGVLLAYRLDYFRSPWLQAKQALVLALSGIHGYLASFVRASVKGGNRQSALFYRILNENSDRSYDRDRDVAIEPFHARAQRAGKGSPTNSAKPIAREVSPSGSASPRTAFAATSTPRYRAKQSRSSRPDPFRQTDAEESPASPACGDGEPFPPTGHKRRARARGAHPLSTFSPARCGVFSQAAIELHFIGPWTAL